MKITPKNWAKFQHYNTRRPPWIKLHRGLLDDYQFHTLPLASKALAPLLWLLASEQQDGIIEAEPAALAFRLRISEKDLVAGLKPLIDNGFFESASTMLAPCKQNGVSETETEVEVEKEKDIGGARKRAQQMPKGWTPNAQHAQLAATLGVNLEQQVAQFTDHHTAKGSKFLDWDAALRTWLRNSQRFSAGKQRNPALAINRSFANVNYRTGGNDNDAI
jgi:hypothetical protein